MAQSEAQLGELSPYKKLRIKVVALLGGKCSWCRTKEGPLQIDHTNEDGYYARRSGEDVLRVILRSGPPFEDHQLLCIPCHRQKTKRAIRQRIRSFGFHEHTMPDRVRNRRRP